MFKSNFSDLRSIRQPQYFDVILSKLKELYLVDCSSKLLIYILHDEIFLKMYPSIQFSFRTTKKYIGAVL